MGSGQYCWDKLDLVFYENDTVTAILHLKNRVSAINIYQQLITANSLIKTNELILDIDNNKYVFSYLEWQAMLTCFEEWFELYTQSELT